MENDLLRQQKQTYLRTHILDKGLSAEDFIAYMGKQKEGGENVDIWTMSDIETLVDLYKRSQDPPGVLTKYKLQDVDLDVKDCHSGLPRRNLCQKVYY